MINKKLIDGQEAITLKIKDSEVTVISSLGGTVYSIVLGGKEILFSDPENELTKNDLFRGRLLFPFNDRIPEGKYRFNGGEYQFPLNCDGKDSIHGLIYNRKMNEVKTVEEEDSVSLILETVIKEGEFSGYPFSIGLNVIYTLKADSFSLDFKVFNPGEKEAPFALGWHPYFTFGKAIESSRLTFSSDEYYDVDENLYYEGNHYSVEGTDLDFTKGQDLKGRDLDIAVSIKDRAEFVLEDGDKKINMKFTKSLFPALQLFIPDDRLSIAVEPISAPSDTFNFPESGLKVLKPGEEEEGSVVLTLN